MKFLALFQVLVCLIITQLHATEVLNLGELSRHEGTRPLNIEIISANPDLALTANKAFQLHGGYQLATQNAPEFTFRLDQLDAASVTLTIESGQPKVTQFQESFSASNLHEATLKACNKAIQKTLGIPGFFTGKLAFVGNRGSSRELYTSDILFNNVRQLTKDSVDIVSPKFSPDGQKIVYTSYYKTGFPDIFAIDLLSGARKTVAGYDGTNTGGCFSPNGSKLAMILTSNGNAELFTADTSGRNVKRLTSSKGLEATPVWSNDGKSIYFSSDPMGAPQLYKIPSSGGKMQRIPTNISKYCAEPTPNPQDSNLLAFTAAVNKHFQISLYDASTKKSHFISNGDCDFMEPCWLNDGRHLLVTKRVGDITHLYVLDSLTHKAAPLHSPSFGNSMMASYSE